MLDPSQVFSSPYVQIVLVLALSFLMGLEREEHKLKPGMYVAAGVRTFPLIALLGYMLVILSPQSMVPVTAGLLAVAAFLVVSFIHKLSLREGGFTSEMAALAAYLVGALVAHNYYWVAVAVAVTDVLLLSAKARLGGLIQRLDEDELITFVKFLLLSVVILPILPNHPYTRFALNPFKTWLVVVVVSGLSYVSYLLERKYKERNSVILSAILGGAYSATITTIALAKQAQGKTHTRLYSGAIVLASAMMYIRLGILIYVFNQALGLQVVPILAGLAVLGGIAGVVLCHGGSKGGQENAPDQTTKRNPLELTTALLFGCLFVTFSVATRVVSQYLGSAGLYAMAGVMGFTDINPFILSLVQYAAQPAALTTAALASIIAISSNNVVNGIYSVALGGRKVGMPSLICLTVLGMMAITTFLLLHPVGG